MRLLLLDHHISAFGALLSLSRMNISKQVRGTTQATKPDRPCSESVVPWTASLYPNANHKLCFFSTNQSGPPPHPSRCFLASCGIRQKSGISHTFQPWSVNVSFCLVGPTNSLNSRHQHLHAIEQVRLKLFHHYYRSGHCVNQAEGISIFSDVFPTLRTLSVFSKGRNIILPLLHRKLQGKDY